MEEKKLNLNSKKIDEYIRIIKKVKESQVAEDDYNLGIHNGIELCISILEDRKPNYILPGNKIDIESLKSINRKE